MKLNLGELPEIKLFSPKQRRALELMGTGAYVCYSGTRGSGKSVLLRWAAVICSLRVPGLRTCVIRMSMPELEREMISDFKNITPNPGGRIFKFNEKKKIATFYNGSTIEFLGLETPDDARKIKGIRYGLMLIDEANEFPEETLERIFASNRGVYGDGKFLPSRLLTGNPGSQSDAYFKKYWVTPDYSLWTEAQRAHKDRYIYIHATLEDNPDKAFQKVYREELLQISDENLRNAWLYGQWDVFSGQFFSNWNPQKHVVEPFDIPAFWPKVRGMDIGYGNGETVCLWLAQNPDTQEIFVYREYCAKGALQEHAEIINNMSPADEDIITTYIDPASIGERKNKFEDESPFFFLLRNNINCTLAVNKREVGWSVVKAWLYHTPEMPPMLKFFNTCFNCIETFPILRYAKSKKQKHTDLDTNQRDHCADALRYALATGFTLPDSMQAFEAVKEAAIDESNVPGKRKSLFSEKSNSRILVATYE